MVLSGEPVTKIVTIQNNALLATNDHWVQIASALSYLLRYLRMLVWPHPLSFDYGYNAIPLQTFRDPIVWLAIALIVGLSAVFVAGVKARRVEAFAVLWFGASIVAVSNMLFLISTNFGERLLYLPSVIACYVVACWLARAAKASEAWTFTSALRSPIIAAPLAVIVMLSVVTGTRRTREWRDQLSLFNADVKKYPNSARLNNYFGNLLYMQAEQVLGQPHYDYLRTINLTQAKTHLIRGLSILDTFQEMHGALGMAEYRLKNCGEAIPHLKRSIAFATYRAPAIAMLTDCYTQMGMQGGAIALYKQLDADGIEYPQGWFELGNDAAARGDNEASVRYFSKFIAKEPDNVAAYANMAAALRQLNLIGESLAAADRCVALKPTPAVAARCLLIGADDLARGGRKDEAMKYFERAKSLDPNNPWIKR
jgi:tetratricopeptide (TPR) repeat protein